MASCPTAGDIGGEPSPVSLLARLKHSRAAAGACAPERGVFASVFWGVVAWVAAESPGVDTAVLSAWRARRCIGVGARDFRSSSSLRCRRRLISASSSTGSCTSTSSAGSGADSLRALISRGGGGAAACWAGGTDLSGRLVAALSVLRLTVTPSPDLAIPSTGLPTGARPDWGSSRGYLSCWALYCVDSS